MWRKTNRGKMIPGITNNLNLNHGSPTVRKPTTRKTATPKIKITNPKRRKPNMLPKMSMPKKLVTRNMTHFKMNEKRNWKRKHINKLKGNNNAKITKSASKCKRYYQTHSLIN
jgi:hypothetical protein